MDSLTELKEPFRHFLICQNEKIEPLLRNIKFKNKNIGLYLIEGKKCQDLDSLYVEFSKKLQFPSYFGKNWDALDECLNDLEWLGEKSYILILKDSYLLFNLHPADLDTFFKILDIAITEWTQGRNTDSFPTPPTPFHVVFHSTEPNKNEVIKKLKEKVNGSISEIKIK